MEIGMAIGESIFKKLNRTLRDTLYAEPAPHGLGTQRKDYTTVISFGDFAQDISDAPGHIYAAILESLRKLKHQPFPYNLQEVDTSSIDLGAVYSFFKYLHAENLVRTTQQHIEFFAYSVYSDPASYNMTEMKHGVCNQIASKILAQK